MRLTSAITALFITSSFARHIPNAEVILEIRQNGQGTTATSTESPTTTSNANTDSTRTTATGTSSETSAASTNSQSNNQASTSATSSTTTTSVSSAAVSGNGTATMAPTPTATPNPLPIVPVVTPALGVGGALLMIAGLALCFIGIKHNQLQIFLSTTLLLTLAIEVLIVYVMNPPVADAVQGGYLVAGVIPGFIGGGVAMVFKEMTEGNGCFLGGFCFAMWLLCLAPGGLIAAKVGRIIIILVFACVAWAADWSHYTRTYGIIVCTAFAGSTAFMLGVDCFSRAGLKEFWLYNWDLNTNVFPLGTTTYPLTRSIQVQEACIIVVAVLGVLTQFQIWKVIRAHRQKQDEARRLDEENREQDEIARRGALEERNRQERRIWENTYGNKTKDSGIGSSIDSGPQKGDMGISVRELNIDEQEKELGRIDSLPHSHDAYPLTDLRPQSSTNADDRSVEGLILSEPAISRKPTWASSQKGPKGLAKRFSSASMKLRTRQRDSAAPSFRNSGLRLADRESNDFSFVNSPNLNSDGPSRNEHAHDEYPEEDEEEIEEDIDDRASSVAATMAEDPDFTAFSRPASQHVMPSSPHRFSKFSLNDLVANALNKDIQFPHVDDDDDDEVVAKRATSPKPVTATTEPNAADIHDKKTTEAESKDAVEASSTDKDDAPAAALSAELLPRSMSRAAQNYRTNEWAKEAGRDAEPIAEDEISDPYAEEPVMVAREDAAARARAEENNAAPQPAPPPPAKEPTVKSKRLSPPTGPRISKAESSRLSSEPPSSVVDTPFNRSQVSSRRQSTMSAADPAFQPKSRTSAEETIAENELVASPVEDPRLSYFAMDSLAQAQVDQAARAKAKTAAAAAAAALVSPSKTTLLDVRNERIQARQTTTSFMSMDPRASTPDLLGNLSTTDLHASTHTNQPVADPNMGIHPLLRSQTPDPMTAMAAAEEARSPEDMTLAERKALIQGSRPGSTTSFYQQLSNATATTPAAARRGSQSSPYTPLAANGSATNLLSTISPPPRMLTSPPPMASTHIYANARPARTQSSTFDANKQAYIREQWLSSNAAAATTTADGRSGAATAVGAAAADSHLARLHALRQQVAAEAAQKEAAAKQRQDQRDAALRMGVAAESHRAALARMQSRAHVGPSAKGSVYPEAKAATATPGKARGRTSTTEISGAGNGEAPRRRGSSAMGFRRRLSGRE